MLALPVWSRSACVWILALAIVLTACQKEKPAAPKPPPPEVTVAEPVQRDVQVWFEFTGNTEAVESVEIRARVQGFLEKILYTDGDFVATSAPLFLIEQDQYQARRDAAAANVKSAEAELKRAEIDLQRGKEAAKTQAISEEEVTRRETARDKADAALKLAKADLRLAEKDLEYTEIKSPIAGRVSRSLVDVGNLVGGVQQTLLATVIKYDPIYVYFDVDERKVLQILQGQSATFTERPKLPCFLGRVTDKEDEYPFKGTVEYGESQVDRETGTLRVRATFPNEEGMLVPGLFVRVRVPAGTEENALLVNERAIGTDLGGKYVLVVNKENVVEHRPVELGPLEKGMRVVRKGIEPGERYIVTGLQRARPGLPVNPSTAGSDDATTGTEGR